MADIGPYGRVDSWDVSSRETRDGPGGKVSLPDHRQSKKTLTPAGVSVSPQPWGNGQHGFCLGRVITVLVGLHHWNGRGTGRTRRPAQPSPEQMDPAVGDSRIVLSEHLPSLVTSAPGARRAVGGMRPAGKNNRSTRRSGCHYVVPNDSVGIVDNSSEVGEIDSSFDGISVAGNVDCHRGRVPSSGDEERNMNSVPSRGVTGGGGGASGLTVNGVAAPVISEVASLAVFVGASGQPWWDNIPGRCWDRRPSRSWESTPDWCCWGGVSG